MQISLSRSWRAAYPGAHMGFLHVGGVDNRVHAARLQEEKRHRESSLRRQFAGWDRARLLSLDTLRAYRDYYRRFGNTYHVQLQLESVLHKEKSLPTVSNLVDACFTVELQTQILTAGHDAQRLSPPLTIDVAGTEEEMVTMQGRPKPVKAGDMVMRDTTGIVCTVLLGQDHHSPISPATTEALYVAYGAPGISADPIRRHLEALYDLVRLFAPQAQLHRLQVMGGEGLS